MCEALGAAPVQGAGFAEAGKDAREWPIPSQGQDGCPVPPGLAAGRELGGKGMDKGCASGQA